MMREGMEGRVGEVSRQSVLRFRYQKFGHVEFSDSKIHFTFE